VAAGLPLLRWLVAHPDIQVNTVLAAAAAGIVELELLEVHISALRGPAGAELVKLTNHGQWEITPPLSAVDLAKLALVGHRPYLEDRENVDDWLASATLIDQHQARWRGQHRSVDPRYIVAEALDAGRSPHVFHQLVERAVEAGVPPHLYGLSPDITPAVFSALAAGAVASGEELAACRAIGLGVADMVVLAAAKVPLGAAVAAQRLGVPRGQWEALLAGMNPSWFPVDDMGSRPMDPLEQGAVGRQGFTLDQLHQLVEHGWGDVDRYWLCDVHYAGRRSGHVTWTCEQAVDIAAHGLTPDLLASYAAGLTAHSKDGPGSTPLTGQRHRGFHLDTDLPDVYRLMAASVPPSRLDDYRFGGCRSVDDVLAAVAAGITGARAARLRARHGRLIDRFDKRRHFATVDELLEVHRRESNSAA
jgi:hypothetical protein